MAGPAGQAWTQPRRQHEGSHDRPDGELDEFDALVRINTGPPSLRERDITVNAVSLEVGRPCAPSNVAEVVALLLNDQGRGVTGQVLHINDPRLQSAVLANRPRWRTR
jgi:hypothetical protein